MLSKLQLFFYKKCFSFIQMQDNVIYVNPYILTLIRDLKANSSNDNA